MYTFNAAEENIKLYPKKVNFSFGKLLKCVNKIKLKLLIYIEGFAINIIIVKTSDFWCFNFSNCCRCKSWASLVSNNQFFIILCLRLEQICQGNPFNCRISIWNILIKSRYGIIGTISTCKNCFEGKLIKKSPVVLEIYSSFCFCKRHVGKKVVSPVLPRMHNPLLWREKLLRGSMQMEFLLSVENSWTEFSLSSKILLCGNTVWLHCATLRGYRFITLGGKCINTWLTGIKTCWLDCLYMALRISVLPYSALSLSTPGYGISTFLFLFSDFARIR